LTLLRLAALQRRYDLRQVFHALRWSVRSGAPWRLLPHDVPPWPLVDQQARRWLEAGCFEQLVHDLRALEAERNERHATIEWQFTARQARVKLKRLYPVVRTELN
jgi:transposase